MSDDLVHKEAFAVFTAYKKGDLSLDTAAKKLSELGLHDAVARAFLTSMNRNNVRSLAKFRERPSS